MNVSTNAVRTLFYHMLFSVSRSCKQLASFLICSLLFSQPFLLPFYQENADENPVLQKKTLRAKNAGQCDQHESLPATSLWFRDDASSDESQETSAGFENYRRRKRHARASQLYFEDFDPLNPQKTSHPVSRSPAAKKPRLRTRLVPLTAESRMDVQEIEEERQNSDKSREESDVEEHQEDQAASDEEEVVDEGREREESGGEMDGGGQGDQDGSDEGDHDEVFGDKGNDGDDGDDEDDDDNRENRDDSDERVKGDERDEADERDGTDDGYDGYDGNEGDGDASGHSDGERRESERSRTQDGAFPGEKYNPPRRISFNRGNCTRSSDRTARVMINYEVKTATKCPCEDRECVKLVNVGTWGVLGTGSTVCVHCGFKRRGDWQGSGYGFMGRKDLVRHLNTSKCRARRGITVEKTTTKEVLGELLYHKINDPRHMVRKKDRSGKITKHYKCFVCDRIVGFRSRHSHHINAKHPTNLNDQEEQST